MTGYLGTALLILFAALLLIFTLTLVLSNLFWTGVLFFVIIFIVLVAVSARK